MEGYKHAYNCGHEVFVGPYRVDAINDDLKIVIEIQGCYAHSHYCQARFRENSRHALRDTNRGWPFCGRC